MQLRGEAEFVSSEALTGLTSLAHSAYSAFALDPPHGAPIVGPGAFGTWAGMHGSSERKNPGAYLWCDPARVGANPVIGVNAQSGKANIMLLAESTGRAAQLRAGAGTDGSECGHDRGRRLYGQRGFVPPGLHEDRWEPCAIGSPSRAGASSTSPTKSAAALCRLS